MLDSILVRLRSDKSVFVAVSSAAEYISVKEQADCTKLGCSSSRQYTQCNDGDMKPIEFCFINFGNSSYSVNIFLSSRPVKVLQSAALASSHVGYISDLQT